MPIKVKSVWNLDRDSIESYPMCGFLHCSPLLGVYTNAKYMKIYVNSLSVAVAFTPVPMTDHFLDQLYPF